MNATKDKTFNFNVTCTTPAGVVKVTPYFKLLDVLISRNCKASQLHDLFIVCDKIRAGVQIEGDDSTKINMKGYTFKKV